MTRATRPATLADLTRAAFLVHGRAASADERVRFQLVAFGPNARPIVVQDNGTVVAFTALFLRQGEPVMGTVGLDVSRPTRTRLDDFDALLRAVAQAVLAEGYTHGVAELVRSTEFVSLARGRYGAAMTVEESGWDGETGVAVEWRVRCDCAALAGVV